MFLIKATLIGKFSNKEAFKQSQLKELTKDYYHSSMFHLHPIMRHNFMYYLFIIPKQFLHSSKNRKILTNGVNLQKNAHSRKIHN